MPQKISKTLTFKKITRYTGIVKKNVKDAFYIYVRHEGHKIADAIMPHVISSLYERMFGCFSCIVEVQRSIDVMP